MKYGSMKYAMVISGLLIMCVPEDANLMRFVMQGAFGLLLFIRGIGMMIEEAEYE